MFVFCVCFVLFRKISLRWADHSYRGVLPSVGVCVSNCVGSRNLKTEGLGPIWAVAPLKKLPSLEGKKWRKLNERT
jgi:hypothetical protein